MKETLHSKDATRAERMLGLERAALKAVEMWKGQPHSLTRVAESENAVFSFMTAAGKNFLRLTRPAHRTREQLEAEIDFVSYISQGGVRACRAIASSSGQRVEVIEDESGPLFASVFEEAVGEPFLFDKDEIDFEHFRTAGRTLSRIHTLSKNFEPVATHRRRFFWHEDELVLSASRYLPETETSVWRELKRLTGRLGAKSTGKDSFGLIHGDFGPTNYRRSGNELVVFDFDDCCYHWFAYDLAVVIYPHGWRKEAARLLDALLEGYAEETELNVEETRAEIRDFCQWRMIYMFLSYARRWGFTHLSDRQAKWFEEKRDNIARGYQLGSG